MKHTLLLSLLTGFCLSLTAATVSRYTGSRIYWDARTPVTVFSGCSAENVTYDLDEGSEDAGEIVGSGFYSEEAAAMGAPFDAPTVYVIK